VIIIAIKGLTVLEGAGDTILQEVRLGFEEADARVSPGDLQDSFMDPPAAFAG
jgi:hypothetical protein